MLNDGPPLVEVKAPNDVPMKKVTLLLNGKDVTSTFVANDDARTFRGLLTGLKVGDNEFVADSNGNGKGRPYAILTITNHPRGGPVLLGSQTQPWVCATPTGSLQVGNTPATNASGLSGTASTDGKCNIDTEYKLFYHTKIAGCSSGLPDPNPPTLPAANNCFKPYVPRRHAGRSGRADHDHGRLAPQAQWNGKVVYSFGASTGQPRLQFRTEQNWADDSALSRGFMVVDNSLTDSLYNSNRILVNETLMMMKEHIVDRYGEIAYTMGNGCSGGSIQQNTVASTFPGLLDGIQPSCDFPDSITTGLEVLDCVLLVNFYAGPDWTALMAGKTQAEINLKKARINGHLDQLGCQSWNNAFGFNNKPGVYVPLVVIDQVTGELGPPDKIKPPGRPASAAPRNRPSRNSPVCC